MSKDIEDIGEEALDKMLKDADLSPEEAKNVLDAVGMKETDIEPTTLSLDTPSYKEMDEKVAQGIELTADEAAVYAIFKQKTARVAQVMHMGVVNDKLQMFIDKAVPEGRKGKFIRDNEDDITRYKNLNYDFIYKEAAPKGLHAEADNRIRVGDVVLMTISEDDLYVLRAARKKKRDWKLDQGKQEYLGPALESEKRGDGLVKSFDNSQQDIHRAHN